MGATTIRRLGAARLDISLREPFGIAGGVQEIARNVLVTIELEDGTIGLGEAAPFPAFNGETQEAALDAIEAARGAVVGADARAWRIVSRDLRERIGGVGSARCAIETALFDALARSAGLPLWALFGGAATVLETDVTIPIGSVEAAAEAAARFAASGFRALKIKVGGGSLERDVERAAAAARAAPACSLRLDGNGGLSAGEALEMVERLRARGASIELFEQPVPGRDLAGLAEVAARSGVPVAADESVACAADAIAIAREGAAHVVNVKPMKAGLVEALEVAAAARVAGLGLMIGGMVESILAMSASACLAAGLGGFAFVDLDTPLWMLESPFEGGFAQRGPRLDVGAIEAGHGVTLRGHGPLIPEGRRGRAGRAGVPRPGSP